MILREVNPVVVFYISNEIKMYILLTLIILFKIKKVVGTHFNEKSK